MMPLQTCDVLGCEVAINPELVVPVILNTIVDRPRVVNCINTHSWVQRKGQPAFANAIKSSNILLADGIGITLAARLLTGNSLRRYTGSDLFEQLLSSKVNGGKLRVFFLGSSQATLDALVHRVNISFPSALIVGCHSPPFSEDYAVLDDQNIIDRINDAEAHVLWLGMTAPKQEMWAHRNRDRLNVRMICSVGAVFDFYAGTKQRPGKLIRKLGLEWLGRLLNEPTRLWRRTLHSGALFVAAVIKEFILLKTGKGRG